MDDYQHTQSRIPNTWRYLLGIAGLALLAWQFFTFLDVLKAHTAQAHQVSQSAAWAGKPVGTMAQALESDGAAVQSLQPGASENLRIMHTALPWMD